MFTHTTHTLPHRHPSTHRHAHRHIYTPSPHAHTHTHTQTHIHKHPPAHLEYIHRCNCNVLIPTCLFSQFSIILMVRWPEPAWNLHKSVSKQWIIQWLGFAVEFFTWTKEYNKRYTDGSVVSKFYFLPSLTLLLEWCKIQKFPNVTRAKSNSQEGPFTGSAEHPLGALDSAGAERSSGLSVMIPNPEATMCSLSRSHTLDVLLLSHLIWQLPTPYPALASLLVTQRGGGIGRNW
jgi:hypothetical protein